MDLLDFRTRPRTAYFYKDIIPEPIPAYKAYFSVYRMDDRMKLAPLEESVDEMRAAGITKGVIFPSDFDGCKEVYEVCKKYPDLFVGLAAVDIGKGVTKCKKDLVYAFKEFDMKGLTISPFVNGVYATDSRYFPLYSLAEEEGKLVQVHSSTHFNPDVPLDVGDPNHIDKVAVNFPTLKLVLGHAGIGFGSMGITVAQRHQNMFIDFTGLSPRHLPKDMIHGINTFLKRKAIFGTNYPSLPYGIAEEWKKVIKEEVQPYFFHKNAARALGLEE